MRKGSKVEIICNSGGIIGEIIGIPGFSKNENTLLVGDIVTVTIVKNDPNSNKVNRKNVAKSIFKALVVTSRASKRGRVSYNRFNYNAVILLCLDIRKKLLVPLGNRVLAPIDEYLLELIKNTNVPINVEVVTKMLLTASVLKSSNINNFNNDDQDKSDDEDKSNDEKEDDDAK